MQVQLRFLPTGNEWALLIFVPAGRAAEASSWIQTHTDSKVVVAPGLAPRTLRCDLRPVPAQWLGWLSAARIIQVDLSRQGTATLFVQGTPLQLARLAGNLHAESTATRQRISGMKPIEAVQMTPRQLEVLCNAVAMGYYDVPHRVDLRELGKAMDLSVSAVSQLLRRAQGQIIRGFIDSNSLARGKALSDQEALYAPAAKP